MFYLKNTKLVPNSPLKVMVRGELAPRPCSRLAPPRPRDQLAQEKLQVSRRPSVQCTRGPEGWSSGSGRYRGRREASGAQVVPTLRSAELGTTFGPLNLVGRGDAAPVLSGI